MSYFIPSSIQKRLLRYALSRLDLLDTDALDLENLNIGWGRKNTIELRAVGLRKDKLVSLLDLPERLVLDQATVSTLRITIPSDIHTSSVVVEVDGVEIILKLREKEPELGKHPNRHGVPQSGRESRQGKSAKSTFRRRPGRQSTSFFSDNNDEDVLPSAQDLATSFLAEESVVERRQLEAALASQSVDMKQSFSSTSSGDDESNTTGMGVGFGLPAFLAAFLQGILDRLSVLITNVTVKLTLPQVDGSGNSSSSPDFEDTFAFHIGEVNLESVSASIKTTHSNTLKKRNDPQNKPDGSPDTGRRHIVLKEMWGALLVGPIVPVTRRKDTGSAPDLERKPDNTPDVSYDTAMDVDVAGPFALDVRQMQPSAADMSDSLRTSNAALEEDILIPVYDDFKETLAFTSEQSSPYMSESSTPEAYITAKSQHEQLLSDINTAIEQSVAHHPADKADLSSSSASSTTGYSEHLHTALRSFREERPRSSISSLRRRGQTSRSPSPAYTPLFASEIQPSVPALRLSEREPSAQTFNAIDPPHDALGSDSEHPPNDNRRQSRNDIVREFMVLSTTTTESMYMSIHDDSETDQGTVTRMPGAWDDDEANESSLSGRSALPSRLSLVSPGLGSPPEDGGGIRETLSLNSTSACPGRLGTRPGLQDDQSKQEQQRSDPKICSVEAKKLFDLNCIDLWISTRPAAAEVGNNPGEDRKDSTSHENQSDDSKHDSLPGSFSIYAEARASRYGSSQSKRERNQESRHAPTTLTGTTISEILLDSLHAKLDLPTYRRLVDAFGALLAEGESATPTSSRLVKESTRTTANQDCVEYHLKAQDFNLRIVERLNDESVHITNNTSYEFSRTSSASVENSLFQLRARTSAIRLTTSVQKAAQVDIGSLSFGFGDEDIVSFSKQARMRSSMRDLQAPNDKDVSISIRQAGNVMDITANTKPIKLVLNLERLDNTLESLGGLSGLLEKSSASDATVKAEITTSHTPSRTVRFESNLYPSIQRGTAGIYRINSRIGGTAVLLQGKNCALQYQSSAIKIISRDTVFGLQIDDMRLTGPYQNATTEAALRLRVRDTGLKYLFRPEEHDLTQLISLLTPSKDKFEDDDDFLVDTLIRQRKKGAVLRTRVGKVEIELDDTNVIDTLQALGQEMSRMSAVTKYLPEESRPGLMTIGVLGNAHLTLQTGRGIGLMTVDVKDTEFAHISFPSLVAFALGKVCVDRNHDQPVLGPVLPLESPDSPPMFMARMIGDELEPTVKIKMWNTCLEYSIPSMMALMELPEDATQQDLEQAMALSVAALAKPPQADSSAITSPIESQNSTLSTKPLALDFAFRDCAIGLTPRGMISKALFVLTDARVTGALPTEYGLDVSLNIRKGAMLLTDNVRTLQKDVKTADMTRTQSQGALGHHIVDLCKLGFVSVSSISAAGIALKLSKSIDKSSTLLDIEVKDQLFLLETCADSTKTLIDTLNALKPPMPPSRGVKYRTEVAPMQDMIDSFSGDAFAVGAKQYAQQDKLLDEDVGHDFDDLSDFAGIEPNGQPSLGHKYRGYPFDNSDNSSKAGRSLGQTVGLKTNDGFDRGISPEDLPNSSLMVGKKWDSTNNRYVPVERQELALSPMKVRIRDLHVIWNLYDGYDWQTTRDTIAKAVHEVETRAEERRLGRRKALENDEDKESLIGDFLFNSIYIGIPVNQDPKELTRQINRNMDDAVSETASHASTVTSRPSSSHRTSRGSGQRLKLHRSKRHKVAFELRGVRADIIAFASGDETQTSIDIQATDFEIFDLVPTSTWKKFATYMHDAGPRPEGRPMIHLEICDVRPVPELTATELVIRATVLPLRLHVDQDALDFVTRFFDFKDDSQPVSESTTEQPYLQRVEVHAVPVKLDYKPKKIDFAGLRSGRTTEFMNFFILESADMVMKHTIVYGTSGFAKLHQSLEDVWMPDIKRNQLPTVLSGLNGVRTLVNVGTGMRDLVVIPIREYKRDGRVVRSIAKGASAFAKTTGGELTRFGAKLAIGAQTALQGAEDYLTGAPSSRPSSSSDPSGWEADDIDNSERRAISNYANQPAGILQGLKGAARSLERDLLVTKDVIIAISGEARESGTAEGAARAIVRHAPTLILRPMIGASKAISQTLMGATNTVDPQNRQRIQDKYKH